MPDTPTPYELQRIIELRDRTNDDSDHAILTNFIDYHLELAGLSAVLADRTREVLRLSGCRATDLRKADQALVDIDNFFNPAKELDEVTAKKSRTHTTTIISTNNGAA